jgi:hypothetical protein
MGRKKDKLENTRKDASWANLDEMERLKRDIYRSDMEKLSLFTHMLRRNALFKKAKISHK